MFVVFSWFSAAQSIRQSKNIQLKSEHLSSWWLQLTDTASTWAELSKSWKFILNATKNISKFWPTTVIWKKFSKLSRIHAWVFLPFALEDIKINTIASQKCFASAYCQQQTAESWIVIILIKPITSLYQNQHRPMHMHITTKAASPALQPSVTLKFLFPSLFRQLLSLSWHDSLLWLM